MPNNTRPSPVKLLPIKHPLVSVILPTYNRADYLPLALDSVLKQTFRDFELIVVDDGSTDESAAIIKNKTQDDPRVIVVHQANRGEYPATNLGLRAAQGQFFTWIHSDDLWPPQTLERRVQTLQAHPEVDFTHGDIQNIDEHGKVIRTLAAVDFPASRAFAEYFLPTEKRTQKYLVHHTSVMFRREFLPRVGYWDESLPYAGDIDWLLRALRTGTIAKAPGILYLYRNHPATRRLLDKQKMDTRAVDSLIFDRYRPSPQ